MSHSARYGAVIFSGNIERLATFYGAVTGLAPQVGNATVAMLASETHELVIHALPNEPADGDSTVRHDAYVKLFFPVESLAEARDRVSLHGGSLRPASEEWAARGFRACEGVDPDGNLFQLRELST